MTPRRRLAAVGGAVAAVLLCCRLALGGAGGAVAAVPGHFPGEGGASSDPVLGPATVGLSLDELRRADLLPFEAVARTAPAIQMSAAVYAAWDGVTPASILPAAVRLLRATGFRGGGGAAARRAAVAGGDAARRRPRARQPRRSRLLHLPLRFVRDAGAMNTSAIPPEPRRPRARRTAWSSTAAVAAAPAVVAAQAGARDRAARRARRDVLGAIARELRRRPSAA